jgi:hypothetical protein
MTGTITGIGNITGRSVSGRCDDHRRPRDEWRLDVDEDAHPWGVPAEPMVYRYRTRRPFGSSRISRPVMSLHDQALRTVIRMEGHADTYSFPRCGCSAPTSRSSRTPTAPRRRCGRSCWAVSRRSPTTRTQRQDPRADVKQFQASSPQPHIDQLKQQAQLFSGETSIPLTSLGVSDMSNPTSADSYVASREDLIARAEAATDDYTRPLRRAMTRALAMQNGLTEIPKQWATIGPKWRSPIYLSRAQQADAGLKQLTAVPWLAETEVGLELLGLDEQQIQRLSVAALVKSLQPAAQAAKQNPDVAALTDQTTQSSDSTP